MTIQNFSAVLSVLSLVDTCLITNLVTSQSYFATSLDYGFDFDQDELAGELSTSLPSVLADQPIQAIEAEEFEGLYRWFNS